MNMRKKDLERMDKEELIDEYTELLEMSIRDSLTGLLNRGSFEQEVNKKIINRTDNSVCAMFIIDLDNFKLVNDTYGHQRGDAIIIQAAKMLSKMFRTEDIVGRLGGDEFVAFISGNITENTLKTKGQQICERLQFVVGENDRILVTASVGVCCDSGMRLSFEEYYRNADIALYDVKNSEKHGYCIKTPSLDSSKKDVLNYTQTVNIMQINSLLDSTDSGIALVEFDNELRHMYASPVLIEMLGADPTEILGMSAWDFIHPDDREKIEKEIKKQIMDKDQATSCIVRVVNRAKREMWWRIDAVRLPDNGNKPVLMLTMTDVTAIKREDNTITDSNLMQVALDQATKGIWEVDLQTKQFRLVSGTSVLTSILAKKMPFPEGFIESGWFHENSIDKLRMFAQSMYEGSSQGYANFRIKYGDAKEYRWYTFSYKAIFDEKTPYKIIGSIEEMNGMDSARKPYYKDTFMPALLSGELVLQASGSLNTDIMNYCYVGNKKLDSPVMSSCSSFLKREAQAVYDSAETGVLTKLLSREALLRVYKTRRNTWISQEYRKLDKDGKVIWVSCVLNIYLNLDTDEILFAMWQNKLDKRREWVAQFNIPLYKDPLSKLYTRLTVYDLASRLIQVNKPQKCALILVETDGIERIYARNSEKLEEKRRAIRTALTLAMGTDCVAGYMSIGKLIFFYPNIADEQLLKCRIEQAFEFVRKVISDVTDMSLLHFVAGGAYMTNEDIGYNTLMRMAQRQCEYWKNTSNDCVVLTNDSKDKHELSDKYRAVDDSEEDDVRVVYDNNFRPLTDSEQIAAFRCLYNIFATDSVDSTAKYILETLGNFYNADRTYILELVEDDSTVIMPYEWTNNKKHSIQKLVTGSASNSYPLLQRSKEEKQPVFLTRKERADGTGDKNWHFAIFPISESGDEEIRNFLCIENGRNTIIDDVLPMTLINCLQMTVKRSAHISKEMVLDSSEDLPNYKSYLEVIYNYSSDMYSSLGVVCVEIPTMSAINSSEGYEYGRRLLGDIVRTLRENFSKALIFRTWDAEFVALCPNITKELFEAKHDSLYNVLKKSYPIDIRIGKAWADSVFDGKTMVDEAKLHMRCDDHTVETSTLKKLPTALAGYASVKDMTGAGKFIVHLQPKLDAASGEIKGAEALVRALDGNGREISPKYFVESLRQSGDIDELDLFVTEQCMKMLCQMQNSGIKAVPISINFAKETLFDPRVPSKLKELKKRYPNLDCSMIEIEISESVTNMNRDVLNVAVDELRKLKFKTVLDNFCAKYSNLTAFKGVNFDAVKLDMTLVADAVYDRSTQMLIEEVTDYCKNENVICTALGVETADQEEQMKKLGVNMVQGYYYYKPMCVDEFTQSLRAE